MVVTKPRRCSSESAPRCVLTYHVGLSKAKAGRSGDEINATTAVPSVFAAHHGAAEGDPVHNHAGRHGSKVADDLRKYGPGNI